MSIGIETVNDVLTLGKPTCDFVYFQARDGVKDNPNFVKNCMATQDDLRGFFGDLAYWSLNNNNTIQQADDFYLLIKNRPASYIPYVRLLHKSGYDPKNVIQWLYEHVDRLHSHLGFWPGIQMQEAKVYSLQEDALRIGDDDRHTLPRWRTLIAECHLWVIPSASFDLTKLTAIWKPIIMQSEVKAGYNVITTDIYDTPEPPVPTPADGFTAEETAILKKICKGFI